MDRLIVASFGQSEFSSVFKPNHLKSPPLHWNSLLPLSFFSFLNITFLIVVVILEHFSHTESYYFYDILSFFEDSVHETLHEPLTNCGRGLCLFLSVLKSLTSTFKIKWNDSLHVRHTHTKKEIWLVFSSEYPILPSFFFKNYFWIRNTPGQHEDTPRTHLLFLFRP